MTITEFNEKYRISILVEATMEATLSTDTHELALDHGAVGDVEDNINFIVYDKGTNNAVFESEATQDHVFLEELTDEFNIIQ